MPLSKKHKQILDRACQRSSPQAVRNQIMSAFGVPSLKALVASAGLMSVPDRLSGRRSNTTVPWYLSGPHSMTPVCNDLIFKCHDKKYYHPISGEVAEPKACIEYVQKGCNKPQWQKDIEAKFTELKAKRLKKYTERLRLAYKAKKIEDGTWTWYDAATEPEIVEKAKSTALLLLRFLALLSVASVGALEARELMERRRIQKLINEEKKKLLHHWPFDEYMDFLDGAGPPPPVQGIPRDYPMIEWGHGQVGVGAQPLLTNSPTSVSDTQFVRKADLPYLRGEVANPP